MSDWNIFGTFLQNNAFGGNKKSQADFVRGFTRGRNPSFSLFSPHTSPRQEYYIDRDGYPQRIGFKDGEWYSETGEKIKDKKKIEEIEEGHRKFIEFYVQGKKEGKYQSLSEAFWDLERTQSSKEMNPKTLLSIGPESQPSILKFPELQWQPPKNREFDPAVQEAQILLLNAGNDVGPDGADGYFGDNTLKAVKEFQKKSGLPVTGKIDEKTWQKLKEYSNER